MTKFFFSIVMTLCVIGVQAQTQDKNVTLTLSGLKTNKGQVIVSIFSSQENFKAEKPVDKLYFPKSGFANGSLTLKLALKPGTYGCVVTDDENKRNKMERNMIGIPKEGFGFSNFYLSGMSRPTFDDFKFEVKQTPLTIQSKLRYM